MLMLTDTTQPFGLPISIIVVIAVAVVLVLGIVLCVALTHKNKKEPKFSHHYMPVSPLELFFNHNPV